MSGHCLSSELLGIQLCAAPSGVRADVAELLHPGALLGWSSGKARPAGGQHRAGSSSRCVGGGRSDGELSFLGSK